MLMMNRRWAVVQRSHHEWWSERRGRGCFCLICGFSERVAGPFLIGPNPNHAPIVVNMNNEIGIDFVECLERSLV
jgi:hypothetical protein